MPLLSLSTVLLLLLLLTSVDADDSAAMLKFAQSLTSLPSGWSSKSSSDYCKWSGVNCDSDRVTSISLSGSKLSGSIPDDISSLSQLKTLFLQSNALSGPIPNLSKLASLKEIYLDDNNFTSVPAGCFDGLSNLQALSLTRNALSGPIPNLSKLASLKGIYLDDNSFTSVPAGCFDGLSNLQNLSLKRNALSGPIPNLSKLASLKVIFLDDNNFTSVPAGCFDGLSNLQALGLPRNALSGPIPNLSKLASLKGIYLDDNNFTSIPAGCFDGLSNLEMLSLTRNALSGPIPSLSKLAFLKGIFLDDNNFTSIPAGCFDGLSNLLALGLPRNALSGPIPNLSKLASLKGVYLDDNNFTSVPAGCFDGLSNLQALSLTRNALSGPIPNLSKLASLKGIYLDDNNFTSVPTGCFDGLSNLETLSMTRNALSGPIPCLSKVVFAVLKEIFLDDNDFTSVPAGCFDGLSNLQALSLKRNALSGPIPNLSKLASLKEIYLDDNDFTSVPARCFDGLSNLQTLSLTRNALSGPIPNLSKLASLKYIYLEYNNFTSVPAGCFDGLSNLQTLSLSHNNIYPWPFPTELTKSTSLTTLSLDNTNVMGPIPDIFDSFANLQNVRLSYNNLTGSLPPSFANSEIQYLWLNDQKMGLSGTLGVLSGMTQLTQVWLHKNQFTGPIPDLSKCGSLFELSLRDNQLTGVVPDSLISLPALVNVSLKNNKLQGPYPAFPSSVQTISIDNNKYCLNSSQAGKPCDPQVTTMLQIAGAMGYPVVLADSCPGNNPCKDWSFVTCDAQGRITTISLANKQLSGTISPAYGNLTALKNLYLQQNNLTGPIPDSLTKIATLQNLDVSNNNISGKVSSFGKGVKVTVLPGNPFIDTDVDTTPPSGSSPSGASGSGKSKPMSSGIIAAIVIVVLIFVAVVFSVVYKFFVKRRQGKFGRVKNPESGNGMPKIGVVGGIGVNTYNGNVTIPIDVLRQVTDNFSEANILGRGGFGVVYKGELHDGTKIAVKRMESNLMGTKGTSEFQAEIAVLTKVRHRHLVALLGHCINGHERLLVYEYMSMGTLGQHLFEWRELGYNAPLTWKQRITIALDVARGVEYLHSLAQQSFIHRDLKPNNILIGDGMRAKVADFGLVKNAPDGKYSVETPVVGTYGYLAPEYAANGRVTTKIDVYAYGVVLMEIITGRKSLDDSMPDEKAHLVSWFRGILVNKDNIPKALDETLNPDEETLESIFKVAELAGHCTAREPHQRPDMGHAVNVLGPFVEQWKPANNEDEEVSGIDLPMSLPQSLQRWQANEDEDVEMYALNQIIYFNTI